MPLSLFVKVYTPLLTITQKFQYLAHQDI